MPFSIRHPLYCKCKSVEHHTAANPRYFNDALHLVLHLFTSCSLMPHCQNYNVVYKMLKLLPTHSIMWDVVGYWRKGAGVRLFMCVQYMWVQSSSFKSRYEKIDNQHIQSDTSVIYILSFHLKVFFFVFFYLSSYKHWNNTAQKSSCLQEISFFESHDINWMSLPCATCE